MMIRSFAITTLCALVRPSCALAFVLALPSLALATPPEDDPAEGTSLDAGTTPEVEREATPGPINVIAEADAAAEGDAITSARTPSALSRDRQELKWIKRWGPEPTMVELGIYGGVLLPSPKHELFRPDLDQPAQGFKQLGLVSPNVGMRLGFYPGRFIGIEAEAGVMPSTLRKNDDLSQLITEDAALLFTARGHLVLQLGLGSVTPFVLVGGGALGVVSKADVLGSDIDPAVHVGGGLKFYLTRYVMLRVEARDVVSYERGPDNVWASHSPEVLLGLSGTFGRNRNKPVRVAEPDPQIATEPVSVAETN